MRCAHQRPSRSRGVMSSRPWQWDDEREERGSGLYKWAIYAESKQAASRLLCSFKFDQNIAFSDHEAQSIRNSTFSSSQVSFCKIACTIPTSSMFISFRMNGA